MSEESTVGVGPAALDVRVLRWTGYGLLIGYFFPLLRGQTGLAKGACLFLATAAPPAIDVVMHSGAANWSGVLLPAVQAFAFALGLLTDRQVLLREGFTSGRLIDVHNLGSVTAWASSIAVALATGIATIIIAGLQPFVIGIVNQPAAPAPPTVTTTIR